MNRFATIATTTALVLGLATAGRLAAQDPEKKADAPAPAQEPEKKADAPAPAPAAEPAKAQEPAAATETPTPPPIPPEVQTKLEAARKAVAEAIAAAEKAGLVQTTIDPPPILEILVTGRADDKTPLSAALGKPDLRVGVSPEVFGAWYTGFGKLDGIVLEKNVWIYQPSRGLKDLFDQRAASMAPYLDAARDRKSVV